MEKVHGPLPKRATAASLPSSDFSHVSIQYPNPLHPFPPSLFGNSASIAHQDLLYQASPWPPPVLRAEFPIGLEAFDSLPCTSNAGDGCLTPPARATLSDIAVCESTCLQDECPSPAAHSRNRFSQPSVLAVPFSCSKLERGGAKSRGSLLASLSAHMTECTDSLARPESSSPFPRKLMDKPEASAEGNVKCTSEGVDDSSESRSIRAMWKQKDDGGNAPSSSSGDTGIGLRLGKRTYFNDATASGDGHASTITLSTTSIASNRICNGNGGSSATASAVECVKKAKSTSPTNNVPRCQAEDCRVDLSGAKDYHRRHKVCEWHSKSSKVRVSNIDQRFCQQCSRFHVLSEFDEGKRSCRRRLAGHNERRRKQQPEPCCLLSAARPAYLPGAKHLFGVPLLDCGSYPFNQSQMRADLKELEILQKPKEETSFASLKLHQFMQCPRGGEEHLFLGGSTSRRLLMSNGNGMNLGCEPAALSSFTSRLSPDHHPETLVSGCALSLLSSSLGFPNSSYSMPKALGISSSTSCEAEIQHAATCSPQVISRASCLNSSLLKDNDVLCHAPRHHANVLSDAETTSVSHCLNITQVHPSTMLAFVGGSSFPLLSGSEVDSDVGSRPVLDLMQMSFAESPPAQSQVEPYTDLEGLPIFGRHCLM